MRGNNRSNKNKIIFKNKRSFVLLYEQIENVLYINQKFDFLHD